MARNKSKHRREEKRFRRQQRDRQRQEQDNVVLDSAATLTCAAETAADFAGQCAQQQEEDIQFDVSFLNLALEIWGERPEPSTQPLLRALQDLLQERQRHMQALQALGAQLERLAEDPSLHIHLDPIEHYQQLVRDRLFSLTEPPEL